MSYQFATVNMERVLSETKEGKRIIDEIRSREDPKKQEYQKLVNDIVTNRNEYQTRSTSMKPEEALKVRQDIEQKELHALRFQETTLKELENYRLESMALFEKSVFPIIDKLSKEKKLTFLFPYPQRWIIFADSQIDITDEIIRLIDQNVKTPSSSTTGGRGAKLSPRSKGGGMRSKGGGVKV